MEFDGQPEPSGVYHTDLLTLCGALAPGSVDMILADLPYGTTACKWDEVIPLAPMWEAFRRVIKPRGAIVLTASQPFTSALVMSNPTMFKYTWIWVKARGFGFFNAKNMPLKRHEDILVFSKGTAANGSEKRMTYNPQGLVKVDKPWKRPSGFVSEHNIGRPSHSQDRIIEFENYPSTVLEFSNHNSGLHPTQKPVALFEYLIRTYTQPGDVVLDPVAGSGTTAVAALNTGRRFIAGDTELKYVELARSRVAGLIEKGISNGV